jgi:homoserine kinase
LKVSVPASSANLGAGFDSLAVALDLRAEVGVLSGEMPERAEVAKGSHPARVAFLESGGRGEVWVRSPIPSGRGLGFSGAVRVGAIALALAQKGDTGCLDGDRSGVFRAAARLEGHGDNVAASTFGGFVVVADDAVATVPTPLRPTILTWVPGTRTSTDASRSSLSSTVSRDDAVFNLSRAGLFVAALAAGRIDLLREATRDRLHQDARLTKAIRSRDVLDAMLASDVWCAWLSGSGPTVAAMCDSADVESIKERLPEGRVLALSVDQVGARWED